MRTGREEVKMEKYEIRLCERPTLTVEEAALYNIGEHKIRDLTEKDSCPYVLYVGRKRLIKRKQFDEYISKAFSIQFRDIFIHGNGLSGMT